MEMRIRGRATAVWALCALAGLAGALATPGTASHRKDMVSKQLDDHLCKTRHGGKFVKIPGFKGEKIDQRLLPDVEWMVDKYKLFITDGYSKDPVHARNGEHPIGLAADIVPDRDRGGSWKKVTKLAKKAEPKQDKPRPPWRWVGYKGDAGHGPRHHLHLSWMHNRKTKFGKPAKKVFTRICPEGGELITEPSGGVGTSNAKRPFELPDRLYEGPIEDGGVDEQ